MTAVFAPAGVQSAPSATACFSVHASAEPSVLIRVLQLFAKRGLVPSQCHSALAGDIEDEMHIDLQLAGMDSRLQLQVAQTLRQIPDVTTVLTSRKE